MYVQKFAEILGSGGEDHRKKLKKGKVLPEVLLALSNDLDTKKAIDVILTAIYTLPSDPAKRRTQINKIYNSQRLLGFDLKNSYIAKDRAHYSSGLQKAVLSSFDEPDLLSEYAQAIDLARSKKDYARADMIKRMLFDAGVEVKVLPSGAQLFRLPNFDPSKLEALK